MYGYNIVKFHIKDLLSFLGEGFVPSSSLLTNRILLGFFLRNWKHHSKWRCRW